MIMINISENEELSTILDALKKDAEAYFDRAQLALEEVLGKEVLGKTTRYYQELERDYYWTELPQEVHDQAEILAEHLLALAGLIADAVRKAPLVSEADQRDVMTGTKSMRASLFLREFRSWTTEVLHDEGTVLGVQPAGQSEDEPSPPKTAKRNFLSWVEKIRGILDLVSASRTLGQIGTSNIATAPARYRPGSAFIMMSMDKLRPELADVVDTVKQVYAQFDIAAVRADDIEHEGVITTRILGEIETAEFLFADLTGERPNVYYEVGYAHALKRRVILFRKAGTGLHFDLAGYNCPEYENLRDLKEQLTRRLVHATNRQPKIAGSNQV